MALVSPAERLANMLKIANRGVVVKGALEPSAISLVKRCDPPLDDTQTAMSIEFKIDHSDQIQAKAKDLTGNQDYPIKETGAGASAYVAKRTRSVELTTNSSTTIAERAMLSAGKAISWIEAAGGDASMYERWMTQVWGPAFEESQNAYKLLLTPGWEKEVMMESDKPESAAYALWNYMPMVKAEFNAFPKQYFGENAYVPWHKYAVVLKAIGAINIAASTHRTKLWTIKGKALWFLPTQIPSRNIALDDFKITTNSFAKYLPALPPSMMSTDLEKVRDLSDWTFFESMSILRKNLILDDYFEEASGAEWVDELIKHAMGVRKRRVLLQTRDIDKIPASWEMISDTPEEMLFGPTTAINVYERKLVKEPGLANPYVLTVAEIHEAIGSVYRASRNRDDMIATLGRYVKDTFSRHGNPPLYSFLHKDLQDSAVRITLSGFRAAKGDLKYKYAYLANYGVILEKHKTLSSMICDAFSQSAFSDTVLGIVRDEESRGVWIEMVAPTLDLRAIRVAENQTPVARQRIVLSEIKESIDSRFDRHYRSRMNLLKMNHKLDENKWARINHRRYELLLKYNSSWKIRESDYATIVDWNSILPKYCETVKKFIRKSPQAAIGAIQEYEVSMSSEEQAFGVAAAVDGDYNPEFSFEKFLRLLEKEVEHKGDDVRAIVLDHTRNRYNELQYSSQPLPADNVEKFDEQALLDREKLISEALASVKDLEIDEEALALFDEQEAPVRVERPKLNLEGALASVGLTKEEARRGTGILDWNELVRTYDSGDMSLKDIETAVRNSKIASVVDSEALMDLDDVMALLG